jgi:hypothetical protein
MDDVTRALQAMIRDEVELQVQQLADELRRDAETQHPSGRLTVVQAATMAQRHRSTIERACASGGWLRRGSKVAGGRSGCRTLRSGSHSSKQVTMGCRRI